MANYPNKQVVINQPYFLGDIIFVMAVVQKYINDGDDVIYPVRDEYMSLQKNFPMVNLVPLSKFTQYEMFNNVQPVVEGLTHVAISFRHSYTRTRNETKTMSNKYECLGFPVDMWRDFEFVRDNEKEMELFNHLGLKEGDKYNLINEFHRPFLQKTAPIVVENGNKNVFMSVIEGYNLFDWVGVWEKAQTIHSVATSMHYILDTVDSMPEEMHIYRRVREGGGFRDHSDYEHLYHKKFIYH